MKFDRLLRARIKERFIVTLSGGETFDGLLTEVDESVIVLRNAKALQESDLSQTVDGELIIPRDVVSYLQRP